MSWIGVIDCNNFFVSCERLFRPDLRNKPVAVLSSNDGCVVARSQEIKDMGVPMGVPYFKVKDMVKDNNAVLFSSHFALYRDVSRRVFATLNTLLDEVEQYSIDEAFFKLDDDDEPKDVAKFIKDEIETKIGIPVSVGVASSKTQAKYAVNLAKKADGITVLDKDEWLSKTKDVRLSELWGVGLRSYLHYEKAGYTTVFDLLQADESRVRALFGVSGTRLLAELQGKIAYHVTQSKTQQKSMMSSRSFKETTENRGVLEDAVAYHTRHIGADLRKQGLSANVVRLSIQASRYSDFLLQGASLEAVLDKPTNDTFALLKITQNLLEKAYKIDVPYKKVGVSVSGLVDSKGVQDTLFETEADQNKNKDLLNIIDVVNQKTNRELITVGDRMLGANWQAKKDLKSPSYTTKWADVAPVKA